MKPSAVQIDPITLEVIHSNLLSIADEMFFSLMKSAYSTNIKERHDHSSCIIDAHGRAVALAPHAQPIHLASMQGQISTLLKHYDPSNLADGDIFISNDPYVAAGTHLPDINFATPVFTGGKLVAFCCNVAHHADVGGIAAGSMASTVEEIYQEGLRLPIVRLFFRGELQADIMNIILLNVRNPIERRGDYNAQIASVRLGARRFRELVEKHGVPTLEASFDTIISRTERRVREAIAGVPDGQYFFEDFVDDDGLGTTNISIRLCVEIAANQITFDFRGTSPQVPGCLNCPIPATTSAVCYALVAIVDRDVPCNEGLLNAVRIIAEPGSFVNPTFPAPVALRTHTTQRICDVVFGALAQALRGAACAASNGANTTAFLSGTHPQTGKGYLYFETYGGGCGARPWKDGKDGVQCHIPNTANTPVEVMETEFPVIVESYALAEDTGGAGRFRGGLALRRILRPLGTTAVFIGAGERFRNPPWGLFGGESGAVGQFLLIDDDGIVTKLPPKPAPLRCTPKQRLVIQSPGAGGYGPPALRDKRLLAIDWRSGKFSAEYMQRNYGLSQSELDALQFEADALDY